MTIGCWSGMLFAFGFACALTGCGSGNEKSFTRVSETVGLAKSLPEKAWKKEDAPPKNEIAAPAIVVDADAGEPINAEVQGKDVPQAAKIKRKIKYTADIRLITDDFPKTEQLLLELIEANDGFLAFADVSTIPGQPRSGSWRARVPVEKFEAFRKGVAKIGEIERNNVNTEDVTAQFYDLENHIKNKKAQEDALRELLKKTTDKMENLLAVQRELSSVRDSIERSEGQLRLLANLSDLTTVSIHVQERRKFEPEKPPEPIEKAAFGTRVSRSFTESWRELVEFGQNFVIGAAALAPWMPLVVIVATPFVIFIRRQRAAAKADLAARMAAAAAKKPQ